jgi:hypothetical protein
MGITWETPPEGDDPTIPTREEIAAALTRRAGRWAVVARQDRLVRAEGHADRINSGREYGAGFEGLVRKVGSEHRVYARKVPA